LHLVAYIYWNILTMHVLINVKSPNNICKWQMGFNSAFKGLNTHDAVTICVGYGGIASPSLLLLYHMAPHNSGQVTHSERFTSLNEPPTFIAQVDGWNSVPV
jgi:hypothetical protein